MQSNHYLFHTSLYDQLHQMDFHNDGSANKEDYHWLLDEYNWKASEVGPYLETEAQTVNAYVPGMGAMPNCHLYLKNVAESHNQYDTAGITRADPGIGAFTAYHNRTTHTLKPIQGGSELFVDYGVQWFKSRESYMGLIPLEDSYYVARDFLERFEPFLDRFTTYAEEGGISTATMDKAKSDLWDMILQSPYKSRPLSALPKTFQLAQRAMKFSIRQTELDQSIRSLEYLKNHGKCLDNIRPDNSTIEHAGRGAFATRFLPRGSLVAPAPLLHIPDRSVLNMYADLYDPEEGDDEPDLTKLIGRQLLLNYCFGHNESSMLLCPYGSGTWAINHNSEAPNAMIAWSNDPMYHNASWLNEPVPFFDNQWTSGIAFEYIALRDIEEGEEVTINYGKEWEEAWNEHVKNWIPGEVHDKFVPPHALNADQTSPLRTHEEDETMYGGDINAFCDFSYESISDEHDTWEDDEMHSNEHVVNRIVGRTRIERNLEPDSYLYSLELIVEPYGDEIQEQMMYVVKDVPRHAISFYYKNYRSEMFVENAFRHDIMIDDSMFPAAWRNRVGVA